MTRALPRLALRRLARSESGLAATEFAIAAPMLVVLMLGGYDLARYALIKGDVDRVGFAVADVTSQYKQLNEEAMDQIFEITPKSMPDFKSGTNGVTLLTSVYLDNKTPKVRWQCASTDGATWTSKIGTAGGTAAVNPDLLADINDNLIVSEIYYRFKPLFLIFFKNEFDAYSQSIYRPRLGTLTIKPC